MKKLARTLKRFPLIYRPLEWTYEHIHPDHVVIDGHDIMLDKRDSLKLWLYRRWEPTTTLAIKRFVKSDWICCDVGAHIGYHTLMMARYGKKVIAFEPDNENYLLLKGNVRLNCYDDKVKCSNQAVGNRNTYVPLYSDLKCSGGHSLSRETGDLATQVHLVKLSQFFDELDFLKVDVEGFEFDVLLGLGSVRPKIIVLEADPVHIAKAGIDPMAEYTWLIEHYKLWQMLDTGYSPKRQSLNFLPITSLGNMTSRTFDHNILCIRRDFIDSLCEE